MLQDHDTHARPGWFVQLHDRRFYLALAIGTLIISLVWHIPEELLIIRQRAGEIILMLVFALAFTYLLRPPVNLLNSTALFGRGSHAGRVWATITVFLLAIGIVVVLGTLAIRPITAEFLNLQKSFHLSDRSQLMNWRTSLEEALAPYSSLLPPQTVTDIENNLPVQVAAALRRFDMQAWAMHWFSHIGFVVELILLPVMVFYFLSDGKAIRHEAGLLVPPLWRPRVRRMASHFDRVLDGYIKGQVIMCLIAWVVVTLVLLAFHVPNALVLGIIAGLTRAVPVIGPMLGIIPIVIVVLLTTRDLPTMVELTIGFSVMHALESKVLLPKVVGREVDLHPVSVIISLLLGLKFFGFVGIFLAVPIAAVLKIVLAEWQAGIASDEEHSSTVINVVNEPELEAAGQNGNGSAAISITSSTR